MIEVFPIYRSTTRVPTAGAAARLIALAIAAGCLATLVIAWRLPPDAHGVGTHEALGLAPCGFLQTFGRPCPMCGMTTSFAHFAKGQFAASFWTQPAGLMLAVATVITFWLAGYIAVTGKPLWRLAARRVNGMAVLWVSLTILVGGWAWKIATFVQ